jgi:tetratricopeptide (TPR) repeat protein
MDPSNPDLGELANEARQRTLTLRVSELMEKAAAAEAMGANGEALAQYRAALELDPRNHRAALAGARLALSCGDLAAARELTEAGLKAAPGLGAVHETLGLVLEAEGEKKEAKRALERALELDPKLTLAKERLRRLRWSILG